MGDFQQTLDKFGCRNRSRIGQAIVESTREAIVVAPLQEGSPADRPRGASNAPLSPRGIVLTIGTPEDDENGYPWSR